MELEMFEGIDLNIKIEIKDKTPPGTIVFSYLDGKKDLIVFISKHCKQPYEDNNEAKYINVTFALNSNDLYSHNE